MDKNTSPPQRSSPVLVTTYARLLLATNETISAGIIILLVILDRIFVQVTLHVAHSLGQHLVINSLNFLAVSPILAIHYPLLEQISFLRQKNWTLQLRANRKNVRKLSLVPSESRLSQL